MEYGDRRIACQVETAPPHLGADLLNSGSLRCDTGSYSQGTLAAWARPPDWESSGSLLRALTQGPQHTSRLRRLGGVQARGSAEGDDVPWSHPHWHSQRSVIALYWSRPGLSCFSRIPSHHITLILSASLLPLPVKTDLRASCRIRLLGIFSHSAVSDCLDPAPPFGRCVVVQVIRGPPVRHRVRRFPSLCAVPRQNPGESPPGPSS